MRSFVVPVFAAIGLQICFAGEPVFGQREFKVAGAESSMFEAFGEGNRAGDGFEFEPELEREEERERIETERHDFTQSTTCLLYTSDAADE